MKAPWTAIVATLAGVVASAASAPAQTCEPPCVTYPGPVGVGTTAPAQKLEVFDGFAQVTRPAGSIESAGFWLSQRNVSAARGIWAVASRAAAHLAFFNQGLIADVMTLFPDGTAAFLASLGIGGQPGQMLELIREDADVGVRFHDPNDASYSMGIDFESGRTFQISRGDQPGANLDFVLAPGGNVGLGSLPTTSRLTVAGGIQVGPAAVINSLGEWTGVAAGLQGPKGLKGDQGDQGVKGDRGDQGIKGLKGDPGPVGLPTRTVAVCNDSTVSSAACTAVCARVASQSGPTVNACSAVSQTGSCSAQGCGEGGCSSTRYALCCVCQPF